MTESQITANTRLLGLQEVNLHVEDSGGSGRPIVLIHGWPLSSASWKLQVPALQSAGYRVIAYDRRGFGRSDKPSTGYSYGALAEDLHGILEALDLRNVTLVGFSMGGGEVARYISTYGQERLHSVVFASAVPPMMMKMPGNSEGPLEATKATSMTSNLTLDADAFYDGFTKEFFSLYGDGTLLVTEEQRQEAIALCQQASKLAALEAMQSFGLTDFREDLPKVTVPTLVIHGAADGIVPFEGSGQRTHAIIPQSELYLVKGGPHGINVSHADEFNRALLGFLEK